MFINSDKFKNAPTNLGIDFNLRFSGQYSDSEIWLLLIKDYI